MGDKSGSAMKIRKFSLLPLFVFIYLFIYFVVVVVVVQSRDIA